MAEGTTQTEAVEGVRVAVLGAGKMGGILLDAFLANRLLRADQIVATVRHTERADVLRDRWGCDVGTNNLVAAQGADVLLLGVKPVQVAELLDEIRPALH